MLPLASLLANPPLSRVQVLARQTMAEVSLNSIGVRERPRWFFSCGIGDQLALRSPSGYVNRVKFDEVFDAIPSAPRVVQAMPCKAFIQRRRRPKAQGQTTPPPDFFKPDQVVWGSKARCSPVDSVHVRLLDKRLNVGGSPATAPVTDTCRSMLNGSAKRDRCPVSNRKPPPTGVTCSEPPPTEYLPRAPDSGLCSPRALATLTTPFLS